MRYLSVFLLLAHTTVVTTSAAAQTPRLDLHGDPLPKGAVARLGTVRFQPSGAIVAVALSPDGLTLATATPDPKGKEMPVDLMDTVTGKTLHKCNRANAGFGFSTDSSQLRFTPDGKSLIYSSWSGITQYDLTTGKSAWSIERRDNGAFAISSDGKRVAYQPMVYLKDAPVRVWQTTTKKEVAVLPGRGASCRGLAFSVDGKRLLLWSLVPSSVSENGIGFGGDQSKAALACIDLGAGKIVGEATAGYGQEVALCPDGETIALEDADHVNVRVLHLPSGAERCSIPVKQAKLAFAPNGKVLLTLDQSGHAALWDVAKGSKIRDLEGNLAQSDHRMVGFSANGKTIAVLDGGWQSAATVVVWNAVTGQRTKRPPSHEGAITCLAYAPGGKLLASGSRDKTVHLWNPATGAHLRLLVEHKEAITAVAFSPDGKLLASSSQDGVTRLTRVTNAQAVANFDGPVKGAAVLAFAADGKVLFAGGNAPQVLAWELADAREVVRLKTGNDGSVVSFTGGGGLALTANGEMRAEDTPERLQLWSTFKKLPVAAISLRDDGNRSGGIRCEAAICSPNGRMIAASQVSEFQGIRPSYGDAQLRLWERASGQQILKVGPTVTTVLAFSPNGRLLASGGTGRSGHLSVGYGSGIDIWDAITGKKMAALPVSPHCLVFSPQGSHLATGGWDQTVLLWEAPRSQLLKESKEPSALQREAWWTALGGNAKEAYQAIGHMLETPDHAVAFLKERVHPAQLPDLNTVAKLIALLDSAKFAERDQARADLEQMGESAEGTIKIALAGKIALEKRRRLEALLRKCEATSPARMRHYRAVAMLEWIDTPTARALLRELADGASDARLTEDARAALRRLQN